MCVFFPPFLSHRGHPVIPRLGTIMQTGWALWSSRMPSSISITGAAPTFLRIQTRKLTRRYSRQNGQKLSRGERTTRLSFNGIYLTSLNSLARIGSPQACVATWLGARASVVLRACVVVRACVGLRVCVVLRACVRLRACMHAWFERGCVPALCSGRSGFGFHMTHTE